MQNRQIPSLLVQCQQAGMALLLMSEYAKK